MTWQMRNLPAAPKVSGYGVNCRHAMERGDVRIIPTSVADTVALGIGKGIIIDDDALGFLG
jgi:hypothetical protein